jgi:SepF-like predicted cell division protein (DUF552 family)
MGIKVKYILISKIDKVKYEFDTLAKLLQKVRDIALTSGDFTIKLKEKSFFDGTWYVVHEIDI